MADEEIKRGPGRPRKDPTLPAEHAGQIDAGYSRNEELAARKDKLQEQIDRESEDPDALESIDPAKLNRPVDNEVGRLIGRDGQLHLSGLQPGYRYSFFTHADGYGGPAKANIRNMHNTGRVAGWHIVEGDMPEAQELIGNDCASGTTTRGWADTVLYRIREEDALAQEAKIARKQAMAGAEEERVQLIGLQHGVRFDILAGQLGPNASQTARQVWGQERPEIVVARSNYGDRVLKEGTIPGLHAGPRR